MLIFHSESARLGTHISVFITLIILTYFQMLLNQETLVAAIQNLEFSGSKIVTNVFIV